MTAPLEDRLRAAAAEVNAELDCFEPPMPVTLEPSTRRRRRPLLVAVTAFVATVAVAGITALVVTTGEVASPPGADATSSATTTTTGPTTTRGATSASPATTLVRSVTTIPATPPSTVLGPATSGAPTTAPQPPNAEPQPSCDGADSPTGTAGNAGDEEDAPPGPPVAVPPGPCIGTWTTYTQAHGLPECICDLGIAPDGTAWVLSEFGDIATFDGTTWTAVDTGILDVNALDFSQDGTLWIATDTGVWTRQAREWIQKGDTPGEDIVVAPDGSVWIYFDGAIHKFDGSSWTEHALSRNWTPLTEGVGAETFIDVAPDGTVWLAADGTLDSYDGTTWTSHSPEGRLTPHGMTVGPDGSVWMASASNPAYGGPNVSLGVPELQQDGYGLVRYDGTRWTAYPIPSYADIAFGMDGSLWVADTFIGALHYDGQAWVHYTEGHGLAANPLELVAVSPDGTVWFKTFFSEVVRYQPTS
jgi:streptogramin lyase